MDEMSEEMKAELNDVRAEFLARIDGAPFVDFYCPILQVDEPAKLCFGHIVNKSRLRRASLPERRGSSRPGNNFACCGIDGKR